MKEKQCPVMGRALNLQTSETTVLRISPSHWTLSVADISNDIDQLVESLNITEIPRPRTFRSTSPLNELRTHPTSHPPTRPSPHLAPPTTHLTPPTTHLTPPHPTPHLPRIRTSSPHLNVTERLAKFSKSCNDLLYNLDNSLGDARYEGDPCAEQTVGDTGKAPDYGAQMREEENRPGSRESYRQYHSPIRDEDETAHSRNIGTRPWEEAEDAGTDERPRRVGSPRRRLTRHRTSSMESQTTYDNYHSTKQSFIVRPTCITPINTTNLFYANPVSRPITPLNTSELLYISSRTPSPEILFQPYTKPAPPNRRPPTRSRGTSPLKVSFEEESPSRYKDSGLDSSRETLETYLDCSKQEYPLDCSRCPTPLKNPLRTSSPKSLLNRSISPLDQMTYIPGKKGAPFPKQYPTITSTVEALDLSSSVKDSSQANWSGYDSDGDGYRTANTSPAGGVSWW